MRWFRATILVAVVSVVNFAPASRFNLNLAHHTTGKRKEEAPSRAKGKGKKGAQAEKGKGKGNGKSSKASSKDHRDSRASDAVGYAASDGDFPPLGGTREEEAAGHVAAEDKADKTTWPNVAELVAAAEKAEADQTAAWAEPGKWTRVPQASEASSEKVEAKEALVSDSVPSKDPQETAYTRLVNGVFKGVSVPHADAHTFITGSVDVIPPPAKGPSEEKARSKPSKPRRPRPSFMKEEEELDAPQQNTSAEAAAAAAAEVVAASEEVDSLHSTSTEEANSVTPSSDVQSVIAGKIAELQTHKQVAIATEDFLEAQRLKLEIKTLQSQGDVSELESQLQLAIVAEDFLEAQRIQEEIRNLQRQAFEEAAEAEVVQVAGLDFKTHIWSISKELYSFGEDLFGFAFGYGALHYWPGGWVTSCPKEGEEERPRHWDPIVKDGESATYMFVGRLDDGKSIRDMVPSKWYLKRGSGYERDTKNLPVELPHGARDLKAIRRSTINSRYLCLWAGREHQEEQEVIILRHSQYATQQACWSHEISIEANDKIADLCK